MNGDQSNSNGVKSRMQKAMDEDQKESGGGGLLRFLPFTTHGTGVEAPSKVVHFHLQKSISNTQPIRVTRERRLGNVALNI
jgi:hypothetical protein